MDKYPTHTACLIVFAYVAQIFGGAVAGAYLLSVTYVWATPIAVFTLMVFVGTRFRGLNNIIHECSHATFTNDRSQNTLIGKFCALLLLSSFKEYRDEHLTHHAHLGDYDRDQDLQSIQNLKVHESLSKRVILRHIVTPLLGRHLPYYLNVNLSVRDGRIWLFLKGLVLFAIVLCILLFPLVTLLFVIIPFTLFYSTLNYWADCLDHGGIVSSDDDLDASRNILAPRLVRHLFFPRNDCFHLVHHLFPHVPARHLETSHRVLEMDKIYCSRGNAVRAKRQFVRWAKETSVTSN